MFTAATERNAAFFHSFFKICFAYKLKTNHHQEECMRLMLVSIVTLLITHMALADITPETVTKTKMKPPADTWIFVRDGFGPFYIFDAASGEMQGLVSTTFFTPALEVNAERSEIYAAEQHYTRTNRGARTDVVTIYDYETLSPKAEIEVPKKVAALGYRQYIALMDDRKHLAIFNLTPAQSVSVVNIDTRAFVGEISTPGCALIMQTAGSGFLQMCGDGRLQLIRLDENGGEAKRVRSKQVFDIEEDPFFDKPVLTPEGWLVISYQGQVFDVTAEGDQIDVSKPWSLLSAEEREANWRPGASGYFGYHAGLDLLFVLMNAKGGYSHDSPGTELWIYDRSQARKVAAVKLEASGSHLYVTPNAEPLVAVSGADQQVHIYDVATTKRVRSIAQIGASPGYIQGF